MHQQHCPLCQTTQHELFHQDKRRPYWRCQECRLVWVAPSHQLSHQQEKSEYDLHDNNVNDEGYRRFLNRLAEPLIQVIPKGSTGLDFGCGPGPALAKMLQDAGMTMYLYDCYYQRHEDNIERDYDFICATEVIEHLSAPGDEIKRLWGLLKPGGVLALMSKLVIDEPAFAQWHYKNDATHISYFSRETLTWLKATLGAQLSYYGDDVFFLRKV